MVSRMRLVLTSALVGVLAMGTAPFGLLGGAEAGDDAPTPGGDEPLPEAPGDDIPSTPGAEEPLPEAPFLTLTPSEGDPGRVSIRSRAVLRALRFAPWPVAVLAYLAALPGVPWIGDIVYRANARIRKTFFRSSPKLCAMIEHDERFCD